MASSMSKAWEEALKEAEAPFKDKPTMEEAWYKEDPLHRFAIPGGPMNPSDAR